MRILLLFLTVFTTLTWSVCIPRTLAFCQNRFNQNLNVTSSTADWTNPGTLSFIIRTYYLQGIDGLLAVCNARQQFAQCLGSQYDSCMSKLTFIGAGESPSDAQAYVQLFRTMEFDCDGGFIQSSRNWPCITNILQTKDNDLNDCQKTYEAQISKDPASLCSAADDYETCVRSQFYSTCGSETSWWSCERTRRGLSIDSDCPSDSCSLVAAGSSGDVSSVFDRAPDVSHVIRSVLTAKQAV